MIKYFVLILIIYSSKSASSEYFNISDNNEESVTEDFFKQDLFLYAVNNGHGSNFRDLSFLNASLDILEGITCKMDLQNMIDSILLQEPWAMQMFDSSAKLPNGLLFGNNYEMGNFDECIKYNESIPIKPQYCLVDIYVKNSSQTKSFVHKLKTRNQFNATIHWGICVPASCNTTDLKVFLSNIFDNYFKVDVINEINVEESFCYQDTIKPLTTLEITYLSLIGLILMLSIISTVYHVIHIYRRTRSDQYLLDRGRKQYSILHEVTLAFSLMRNVKKIFEVKTKSDFLSLDCISGMKAISMFFILAGHALIFLVSSPVTNVNFHEAETKRLENAVFLNNPLLVDSFLLISGFLMSRLLLLELDKGISRAHICVAYLVRYIRLTPAYLVMIGFYSTFLIRLNDGPLWKHRIGLEQARCEQSWWANLLYINNYASTDDLCMFQSWYLAVDTQLFVLAPFIIYPMWKGSKTGWYLLGTCLGLSTVIPFYVTYAFNLDPTLMIYAPEIVDLSVNTYFKSAYIKTHMRASAYLCGILFGYIVHQQQKSKVKVPKHLRKIGWVAAVSGLTSLFSVAYFYVPNQEYNVLVSAIYCSIHRLAWSFAVGWTIFASIIYNNGIVTKILSWKLFTPFARLTYCAYLVNGFIELYNYGSTKTPRYLSINNLGMEVAAHIIVTYVVAFILCIFFESPIHNVEKIILKLGRPMIVISEFHSNRGEIDKIQNSKPKNRSSVTSNHQGIELVKLSFENRNNCFNDDICTTIFQNANKSITPQRYSFEMAVNSSLPKKKNVYKPNGLKNIGNTCFLNSVVQCLSNTKPLLEYVRMNHLLNDINTTTSVLKGSLAQTFSKIIKDLWTEQPDGDVINPTSLKAQIQQCTARYLGDTQEDAQEFLRLLLEVLHEDINRIARIPLPPCTEIDESLCDQDIASESWRRYLRHENSRIIDLFAGQLKSTLTCTYCDKSSVKFDPFWDLSLSIPKNKKALRLTQCLKSFTKEEILDGTDKPICSYCNERRAFLKSIKIQRFPEILVIHLKRYVPVDNYEKKLNVKIEFPLEGLDMTEYAANRVGHCQYDLYALSNHSGSTYNGHYNAYCRHPYSQKWYEFDDSSVRSISMIKRASSKVYVLFYELKSK